MTMKANVLLGEYVSSFFLPCCLKMQRTLLKRVANFNKY